MNVVPPEITVGFDMRLALDVDHENFLNMIDSWCKEAGKDVRYTFRGKNPYINPTPLNESNPWWVVLKHEIEKMLVIMIIFNFWFSFIYLPFLKNENSFHRGLKWKRVTAPGASDNRFIREVSHLAAITKKIIICFQTFNKLHYTYYILIDWFASYWIFSNK